MNRASQAPTGASSERGQALIVVAVTMAALLGIGALAVDLGYLYVTRNELQNVADGAALAGARMLGHIYQGVPQQDQAGFVCTSACVNPIKSTTQDVASHNAAGGVVMSLDTASDVAIGQWDGNTFTPTFDQPDAVQVISRREPGTNGPVGTFFARTMGFFTASVNAIAVAALTGQSTSTPGEVELPIGIASFFFENPQFCHDDIQFYPTNDPASCAGWTSWDYKPASDNMLGNILEDTVNYQSPAIKADSTFINFTGGTLSTNTFDDLLTRFQHEGCDTKQLTQAEIDAGVKVGDCLVDPVSGDTINYCNPLAPPQPTICGATPENGGPTPLEVAGVQQTYPDGTPRYLHRWDTTVPVFDQNNCTNPNQSIMVVGFARVVLTDVLNAPDKLVRGTVECNYVSPEDNRGGGGNYGIKGSIPGLVR